MRRPNRPATRPRHPPGTVQLEVTVTIPRGLQDALAHLSGRRPPEEYISRTVTADLRDWLLHLELGPAGAAPKPDGPRQTLCGHQVINDN